MVKKRQKVKEQCCSMNSRSIALMAIGAIIAIVVVVFVVRGFSSSGKTLAGEAYAFAKAPLQGDITSDGLVDVTDFQCMTMVNLATMQQQDMPACLKGSADLNCDGEVNIVDVQLMPTFVMKGTLNEQLDMNGNGQVDACERKMPEKKR